MSLQKPFQAGPCPRDGSMVAGLVPSLALAWGVGEIAGYRHSQGLRPLEAGWFYGAYAACVAASAALVWSMPNLLWLNITAQVLNAFLLPMVIGFLVALAAQALPDPPAEASAAVSFAGLFGEVSGLL
jgi:hypothetical protein